MRFQYPLQKIVDLKGNEKNQAEWQLSRSIGKLLEEQASLARLIREKEEWRDSILSDADHFETVADLQLVQHYVEHLESQIQSKRKDVFAAQTEVDADRSQLTLKMQDEKIWSKAKQKAYRQFSVFVQQMEQKELDEMSVVRYKATSAHSSL